MKKIVSVALALTTLLALTTTMASCGKKAATYKGVGKNITGEISFMTWGGDNKYYKDLGHQTIAPKDITSSALGLEYAIAQAFNKEYPNVTVDFYGKSGSEGDWSNELEKFKAEHGHYPSIYSTKDVGSELEKGMCADLSIFSADPEYQNYNKTAMSVFNWHNVQAAVPFYLLPWGIFVNKSLANAQNIDVPPVNWTMDQYADFEANTDNKTYWGAMDAQNFFDIGTTKVSKMLATRKAGDPYVDFNNDEVKSMLSYTAKFAKSAIWPTSDLNKMPAGMMDQYGWWSWNFFLGNRLLTDAGDPWMMGGLGTTANKVTNYDIYPDPSTAYRPNTIMVLEDGQCIHNFAMDDGNPVLSPSEKAQEQLAWTYEAFSTSLAAMQNESTMKWSDNGVATDVLSDSISVRSGQTFTDEMKVWYGTDGHKYFGDATKAPGWAAVMDIYQKGAWYLNEQPSTIQKDGKTVGAMDNMWNAWDPKIVGCRRTDPNWVSNVSSRLGDWTTQSNDIYKQADADVIASIAKYYTPGKSNASDAAAGLASNQALASATMVSEATVASDAAVSDAAASTAAAAAATTTSK